MRRTVVAIALTVSACAGAGELPGRMADTSVTLAAPVVPAMTMPGPEPESEPESEPDEFTADDLWELHDRLISCLSAPPSCDVASIALAGSGAHSDLSRLLDARRRDGLVAVPSPTPMRRQVHRWWSDSGSASVQWCWLDDLVLVAGDRGARPPVIVDDTAVALDEVWTLSRVQQQWLLSHRQTTRRAEGIGSWCG
jgi:hypothetical protein